MTEITDSVPPTDKADDENEFLQRGSYFPIRYAFDFLRFLHENRDRIEVITYDDLPWGEDLDAKHLFPLEYASWKAQLSNGARDRKKIYVLIQHDVDRLPERTWRFLEEEARLCLPSNVMIFNRRFNRKHLQQTGILSYTEYDLPVEMLRHYQNQLGFVFGYHVNAYGRAVFDSEKAMQVFSDDVKELRKYLRIRYFSPHGGARSPAGETNNSVAWPPEALKHSIRWVHNSGGVRFDGNYSDGGLNNPKRDPEKRDLRDFVRTWRRGKRYRVLLHPQYYDEICTPSERMLECKWYRDIVAGYASNSAWSAWSNVAPR